MSDTVIKLNALNSGPYTATNNRVRFRLTESDAQAVYAGNKISIDLHTSVNVTSNSWATSNSIVDDTYNFQVKYKDVNGNSSNVNPYNISLVREYEHKTDKFGIIDGIRRLDALGTAVNDYVMNPDMVESQDWKAVYNTPDDTRLNLTPWVEFRGEGDIKSTYNNYSIRLPYGQLSQLGKKSKLPLGYLGNRHDMMLELNLDNAFNIEQIQGDGTRSSHFGSVFNTQFSNVSTAGDVTTLTTEYSFNDLDASPYWVGQVLQFSWTGNGGASNGAGVISQVQEINYIRDGSADDNKITLTLNPSLITLGSGEDIHSITCDGVNYQSASLQVDYAEITLFKTSEKMSVDKDEGFVYQTVTTEEDTIGTAQRYYQRMFNVEPNCFNVLFTFPSQTAGDPFDILSADNEVDNYRLRVDNVPVTDRDIVPTSPLHYDLLNKFFVSSGYKINNLLELTRDNQVSDAVRKDREIFTNGIGTLVIGSPVPVTNNNKQVQLNIDCSSGNGINRVILFKYLIRNLK